MEELLKALNEQKRLWEEYKSTMDKAAKEGKQESAEYKTKVEKMEKQMEQYEKTIDELQVKLNRPDRAGGETEEQKSAKERQLQKSAFFKTISGKFALNDDEKQAWEKLQAQKKDMLLANDASLGYLAPTEFLQEILRDSIEMSPIRSLATVRTISGRSIQQPKINDAETLYWLDEQSLPTNEDFDSELLEFPAHTAGALRKISQSGLEDISYLEAELSASFARSFAKGEGSVFLTGNGVKKPEGIISNGDVEIITSDVAGKVDFDDLAEVEGALKEIYLSNATWLINRSTKKALRKLKDNNQQYLWQPAVSAKEPATIMGYPVVLCPDLANIAANAKVCIFGDIRAGYKIVDRIGLTVQVLTEKYAPLVGYLARKRVGGQVQLPEALKILKVKA